MSMEGFPPPPAEKTPEEKALEDSQMEQQAAEMMTPTERKLSADRNRTLSGTYERASFDVANVEDPIAFAKNIENVSKYSNRAELTHAELAFKVPQDKIKEPEVYGLKMKGSEYMSSGSAVVNKGLLKGSSREYFLQDQSKTVSTLERPTSKALCEIVFYRAKMANKIMENERAAGRAVDTIREEVRREILAEAQKEPVLQ